MSIVETTVSTMETDFPKGDTIISAYPTSFLAAKVIISVCKKTACADETIPSMTRSLILRSFA